MFATLRYNQATQAMEQPSRPTSQRACTHCRARKLRCSGAENGCDRCKAKGIACEYPQPARRKGARQPKTQPLGHSTSSSISTSFGPASQTTTAEQASDDTSVEPFAPWKHDSTTLDIVEATDTGTQADSMNGVPQINYPDISAGTNVLASPPTDMVNYFGSLAGENMVFDDLTSFGIAAQDISDPFNETKASNAMHSASTYSTKNNSSLSFDGSLLSLGSFWRSDAVISTTSSLGSPWALSPPSATSTTSQTSKSKDPTFNLEINQALLKMPSGPNPPQCQCTTIALRLQETLCITESQCSLKNMGRVLRTNKSILVHCNSLIDCVFCSTMSYFMMLLTVLCQRITSCYNKVLFILTEQYNRLQRKREQPLPHFNESRSIHEDDDNHQVVVRDYDLDMDEEPCIFGALTLVQLRKLSVILRRIKELTISQHWDCHTVIIDETEKQLKRQIGLYDKTNNIDL